MTARWIALTGPTACGKTAAALAVAAQHPVEIISVDSALVYRGMDIGTAKPGEAERAAVATTLYRIQTPATGKGWVFVCESCCIKAKPIAGYRYGGTWQGYRH